MSDRRFYAKARYYDPALGRFLTQDSFLGRVEEPPSLHRYAYAANRPTYFVDPTGHDFTVNNEQKWGRDGVAAPVLSGTVTKEEVDAYLWYVEKYGTRDQIRGATFGATGLYSKAFGREVAKIEASGLAGLATGGAATGLGAGVVVTGGVAGASQGFVEGWIDGARGKVLAARTATGAVVGAAFGYVGGRFSQWMDGGEFVVQEGAEAARLTPARDTGRPAGDYDPGWDAYYNANPQVRRSVGAAGGNDGPDLGGPFLVDDAASAGGQQDAIVLRYSRNPEHPADEFAAQAADQAEALRGRTAAEIKATIERVRATGRLPEADRAARAARRASPEAAKGKAALHRGDSCIGCDPNDISGFGHTGINSSLGSQNRNLAPKVYDAVKDLPPDVKPKVILDIDGS